MKDIITEGYSVIDLGSDTYMKSFLECCNVNFLSVCSKDEQLFSNDFYILPGINISPIFNENENNRESIWKYLHTYF